MCKSGRVKREREDDGAAAEDRRRAQHHGDDHQLDVADPPLPGGAQHHQADGGTGGLFGPEHGRKCAHYPCRMRKRCRSFDGQLAGWDPDVESLW